MARTTPPAETPLARLDEEPAAPLPPPRREPRAGAGVRLAWLVAGLLLVALGFYLASRDSGYNWGWYVVLPTTPAGRQNLLFLLDGLWYTVALSLIAIVVAMVIGLVVALPGLADDPWARRVNRVYVEVVRSIPVLVMLLWVHYGLPVLTGLNFEVFTSGVIALALCESAFIAEVFRGGIQSVHRGQHEAAEALGLGYWHKMRFIILPQAIRRMLPPLGNQFVYMLKMSSLVSVIGLSELTRQANELVTSLYRPLEIYSFLVLEYMALILIVSAGVRRLERRMAADERRL